MWTFKVQVQHKLVQLWGCIKKKKADTVQSCTKRWIAFAKTEITYVNVALRTCWFVPFVVSGTNSGKNDLRSWQYDSGVVPTSECIATQNKTLRLSIKLLKKKTTGSYWAFRLRVNKCWRFMTKLLYDLLVLESRRTTVWSGTEDNSSCVGCVHNVCRNVNVKLTLLFENKRYRKHALLMREVFEHTISSSVYSTLTTPSLFRLTKIEITP